MAIVPDDKDWTWVLERPCPECGFDVRPIPAVEVGEALRANSLEWGALLAHPQARVRPDDATWSARSSIMRCGSSIEGRANAWASPRSSRSTRAPTHRRARSRSHRTRSYSSPTSGTTFLAASVGVDARRSAT